MFVVVQYICLVRVKRCKQFFVFVLFIVVQFMEMGFFRRNIEFVLKFFMGVFGNVFGLFGVEVLVGWLLDYFDVQVMEFLDVDIVFDEYFDEEVVEDMDDVVYFMFIGVVVMESQIYKK